MLEVLSFLLIGCFAGILAGLLGLGGGLVIVPLLVVILSLQDFPADQVMRVAVATSLGTIMLTALSSAYAHHRQDAIQWSVVFRLGAGLLLGAFCSTYLVDLFHQGILKALFVCFELFVAYQLYAGLKAKPNRALPSTFPLIGAGGAFGVMSGLIGIGGGTLVVPFLVWCQVGIRQAVAISSACGFFIALGAIVGFVFFVRPDTTLPDGSLGYLYMPALLLIGFASVLTAPLGARIAHNISTDKLRKLFSWVLVVMVIMLLLA